jgi:phosphoglycolate phosphatase
MAVKLTRPLPSPAALLFDLDGTLVDSVADLAASANHLRAHYGLAPLSHDVVRSSIGDGARKLVLRTLAGGREADEAAVDPRQVDEGLRIFRAHYAQHLLDRTLPYPGVRETLRLVSASEAGGPRMAVVSNKPQEMCEAILRGLRLDGHFVCIVGARSGVPVKPAPDLVRLALDGVAVEAARAWVVGDSPNDVGAGKAAGCATVALTGGLSTRAALQGIDPDALLDTFDELLPLLSRR